jgi:hypothetical protein
MGCNARKTTNNNNGVKCGHEWVDLKYIRKVKFEYRIP